MKYYLPRGKHLFKIKIKDTNTTSIKIFLVSSLLVWTRKVAFFSDQSKYSQSEELSQRKALLTVKTRNVMSFSGLYYAEAQTCFVKKISVCNFIKKETLAQVFPVNFLIILRTPFLTKHLRRLLLIITNSKKNNIKGRLHSEIFLSEYFMKY